MYEYMREYMYEYMREYMVLGVEVVVWKICIFPLLLLLLSIPRQDHCQYQYMCIQLRRFGSRRDHSYPPLALVVVVVVVVVLCRSFLATLLQASVAAFATV